MKKQNFGLMDSDIVGMDGNHVGLDDDVQKIHRNELYNKDSQVYRRATKLVESQRLFFSDENLVNVNFYSELLSRISELGDSVKQLRLVSSIEFLSIE